MTAGIWGEVFVGSLQTLWYGAISIVPSIILAILVFLIGWLFASLVEKAVSEVVKIVKLDSLLAQTGLDEAVHRAGFRLNSGLFIGGLAKWFIVILFLKLSLGIVRLTQVDDFLEKVLVYLPQVIVAAMVLIIGSIIADAMQKIVTGSAKAANVIESKMVGSAVKWVIWIFTIFIALTQLQIGVEIVLAIVYGLIGMLALAGGLAFGLGGREAAAKVLNRLVK